jgi:hypothetical protein
MVNTVNLWSGRRSEAGHASAARTAFEPLQRHPNQPMDPVMISLPADRRRLSSDLAPVRTHPSAAGTVADADAGAPASTTNPWRHPKTPGRVLVGTVAGLIALATAAVLRRSGTFSYTLDDPYIHLRVAELIARGTYGINPGEASAPASSALWPFLLAPGARWGAGVWLPLLVATACTLVSARLAFATIRRGWWDTDRTGWSAALLAGTVVVAGGLVAVAFTGMEHSLQVALTLAVLLGVSRVADGGAAPWWLWAALAIGPLVRYEGLAVSGVAVVALLVLGERRRPLLAIGAAIAGLLAFSGFLVAVGLSPVPASILVKASANGGTGLAGRIETAADNWRWVIQLGDRSGYALLITGAVLACASASGARRLRREIALLSMSLALLIIHISVFSHEGAMRYQLYAIAAAMTAVASALPAVARATTERVPAAVLRNAFAATALAVVAASLLTGAHSLPELLVVLAVALVPLGIVFTRRVPPAGLVAAALVLTTVAGIPMIERNRNLTNDAAAIHAQQYQLHRFVEAYDGPIAANDIGWVAYRNDHRVLDLWGLASPAAREARAQGDPGWMDDLMATEDVDVAVIYDTWFGAAVPDTWIPVATLHTTPKGMTGGSTVTFYARSRQAAVRAEAALTSIEPGLPDGAQLRTR